MSLAHGPGLGGASLLLAMAGMAACAGSAPTTTVRVFAAASLSEAFRDIAAEFERGQPAVSVELHTAGSQVLRTQIEQGAAADVYAFADLVEAEALRRRGLVQPYRVFAFNRLCVVRPEAAPPRVQGLPDLAAPGMRVVVAAGSVPAGRYAAQALARAGAELGPDYARLVEANIVSRETNVRAVLAKVALGEADAGIVYVTDALGNGRVKPIDIPDRWNVVVSYPLGLVGTRGAPAAEAFASAVLGAAGRGVLARRGFGLP